MIPSKEAVKQQTGMSIWKQLYGMIWLNVLAFILVPSLLTPALGLTEPPVLIRVAHVVAGIAVLGLAAFNYLNLAKTECPDRLKRISKSTVQLSVFEMILGFIMALNLWAQQTFCNIDLISLAHIVTALAIITQAASVATGYDMWEEKEFEPKKMEANPKPS